MKKHALFERKGYFWAENNLLLFPHTRATQFSNVFVKAAELLEQLFDKLPCNVCCTYAVSTSAFHQEEELPFRGRKLLAVRLLFLRLRGLIIFRPKFHKETWLLICNLKLFYRTLCSQYKHRFQREEFAFGHKKRVCTNFHLTVKLASSVFVLWAFTGFVCFFPATFTKICEKIGSPSLFFFRRRVMFLKQTNLANQVCIHYYNTTHCSLSGFRKLF